MHGCVAAWLKLLQRQRAGILTGRCGKCVRLGAGRRVGKVEIVVVVVAEEATWERRLLLRVSLSDLLRITPLTGEYGY